MTSTVGFLLLPRFSALAYASCIEPLRVCNELSGSDLYRCVRISEQTVVQSEDGLSVSIEQNLALPHQLDAIIVCGGLGNYQSVNVLRDWFKVASRQVQWIAGIASGGLFLAETGKLENCKASLPETATSRQLSVEHNITLSRDLFSTDGTTWTCRGGTAPLDMMLFYLSRNESIALSELVAQAVNRQRVGEYQVDRRRLPDAQIKRIAPVLAEAVELMEANLEEPLSTDDIARHLKISRRQLERLFKRHLNAVPSRYYAQIRLEFARDLVQSTSTPITDIALRSGFSSGAHFSTSYRAMYGVTPTEDRTVR